MYSFDRYGYSEIRILSILVLKNSIIALKVFKGNILI
jgi:hypothetical protein